MIKLNSEHINDAWEDYKGFLQNTGFANLTIDLIEPHFKQGFALGEAFAKGEQVKPIKRELNNNVELNEKIIEKVAGVEWGKFLTKEVAARIRHWELSYARRI